MDPVYASVTIINCGLFLILTFFLLTGDMEVEYHPVKAESVARCSRHLVDANFTVDMLDPVINGAYVHIGYSSPITKVHCYTCRGAETLQKENKILSLTLCAQLFECVLTDTQSFSILSTKTGSIGKSQHCILM